MSGKQCPVVAVGVADVHAAAAREVAAEKDRRAAVGGTDAERAAAAGAGRVAIQVDAQIAVGLIELDEPARGRGTAEERGAVAELILSR